MSSRADRDGCGCPPWVLRCAHWEGQILVMGPPPFDHNCCGRLTSAAFILGVGTKYVPCSCAGCGFPLLDGGPAEEFRDLPAAEAEFARREAVLLGR